MLEHFATGTGTPDRPAFVDRLCSGAFQGIVSNGFNDSVAGAGRATRYTKREQRVKVEFFRHSVDDADRKRLGSAKLDALIEAQERAAAAAAAAAEAAAFAGQTAA